MPDESAFQYINTLSDLPEDPSPLDYVETPEIDSLRTERRLLMPRAPVQDVKAQPFPAISLLVFYDRHGNAVGNGCSFFVEPDVMLTAGHNTQIENVASIAAFPGYDGVQNPSVQAIKVLDAVRHSGRDAGIMIVEGTHHSVIEYRDAQQSDNGVLAGYAYSENLPGPPRLTAGSATLSLEGSQAAYQIRVRRGDSGAPLFSQRDRRAIGIHFYGENRPSGFVGLAERLDGSLQQDISRAINNLRRRIRSRANNNGLLS